MAKNSVDDWDTTAGNNTDVGGENIAEGCNPSDINNAIREVMAQIKTWSATLLSTVATTFSASDQATIRANISAPIKGHIYGLTLSNNSTDATNDIDIAAGEAASTETNPVLMVLASALTKRLDAAWAVGTGNGGLDTGSIANTTYHVWLIRRSDTGVVDVLFSTSASSPTMPTNYDQKRRIGSIVRTSGAIKAFKQNGNTFLWDVQVGDAASVALDTSGASLTLTVPTGIVVDALYNAFLNYSSGGTIFCLFSAFDQTNTTPSGSFFSMLVTSTAPFTLLGGTIKTNTSGQIRQRGNATTATFSFQTRGWIDLRDSV